jgi:hypothetical protein
VRAKGERQALQSLTLPLLCLVPPKGIIRLTDKAGMAARNKKYNGRTTGRNDKKKEIVA